jgi:uncharacterized membrane protein
LVGESEMKWSAMTLSVLAFGIGLAFANGPAAAEFKVCNQSVGVYNLAVGAEINQHFNTEGWWVMPANTCVIPIKQDLDSLKLRYVYVYAETVSGESAFEGNWDMCVDSKRFKIEKIDREPWNCWVRGFKQVKFLEVDTGSTKSWTLYVKAGKN